MIVDCIKRVTNWIGKIMNFIDEFLKAVETIKSDETAFVMANTKAEHYLLQKVGYELYKKRELLDFDRIALEYTNKEVNRVDLAFLKDNEPILGVEAKYQYHNDRICTTKRDEEQYVKDIGKLRKIGIECYFVLFIAHFEPFYPHFKYGQPNKGKDNPDRIALENIFKDYGNPVKEDFGIVGVYRDEKNTKIEVKLKVWIYQIIPTRP